jgi:hypothetical protein
LLANGASALTAPEEPIHRGQEVLRMLTAANRL